MAEIELRMSVDEVNLVLESLGEQPFVKVYGLVAKIQRQAQDQLREGEAIAAPMTPPGAGVNGSDGG